MCLHCIFLLVYDINNEKYPNHAKSIIRQISNSSRYIDNPPPPQPNKQNMPTHKNLVFSCSNRAEIPRPVERSPRLATLRASGRQCGRGTRRRKVCVVVALSPSALARRMSSSQLRRVVLSTGNILEMEDLIRKAGQTTSEEVNVSLFSISFCKQKINTCLHFQPILRDLKYA